MRGVWEYWEDLLGFENIYKKVYCVRKNLEAGAGYFKIRRSCNSKISILISLILLTQALKGLYSLFQ